MRRQVLIVLSLTLVFLTPAFLHEAQSDRLIARQVTLDTASTDLFSGSDADGGIGDWYLSNGIVEAIVDNIGFQPDVLQATGQAVPIQNEVAPSGGTLIDLALAGHNNDQFDSAFQVVNFNASNPVIYVPAGVALRNPSLPPVIARVDESAGIASLTVYGFALFGPSTPSTPSLPVVTEYSLRRGENFIRLKTTIMNQSSGAVVILSIVDAIVMANRGNLPFAVYPERGFHHPELDIANPLPALGLFPYVGIIGRLSPEDGIVDPATMTRAGEVSYTVVSPENGTVLGANSDLVSATGNPPLTDALDPGQSYTYQRRIIVGDRNDVASSSDHALQHLSSVYRYTTGSVRGRLVAPDGLPFRANLEITQIDLDPSTPVPDTLLTPILGDDRPLPLTHIRTNDAARGEFQAVLPAGIYDLRILAEERPDIEIVRRFTVTPGNTTDLGTTALTPVGRLSFRVSDAADPGSRRIPAKITIKGRNGTPDPRLGNPLDVAIGSAPLPVQADQGSPALNVVYTATGQAAVAIRPGDYRIYASRGLEYDIDFEDVTVSAGQTQPVDLAIQRVVNTSYVSGDFHIHSVKSADSSVPLVDRVMSFAGEGVQVMVSTDHDTLVDYQPIINQLGLERWITSIVGDEVTTASPVGRFTQGVGHFNGWPLTVQPNARKDGAPEDEFVEPNVVYDRLRRLGAQVVQLNHPESPTLGLFAFLDFDPTKPVQDAPNNFLLRPSILGTGTRNLDFDAIEVYNGPSIPAYRLVRLDWFGLLNQGIMKTATAVTDTHQVTLDHAGFPRTYVAMSRNDLDNFDPAEFNRNLKAMKTFGTSGPIVDVHVEANNRIVGLGEIITATSGPVRIHMKVQAAPWIPVEEARLYANGRLITSLPAFPRDSVVRLEMGVVFLQPPARDTYFVVEAGQRLPDDLTQQPPAGDLMSIIEPGVVSLAFTNPIFVDVDGNGVFDPPGVSASLADQQERVKLRQALLATPSDHLESEWPRFKINPEALRQFMKRVKSR
jgi:hypothetical protein